MSNNQIAQIYIQKAIQPTVPHTKRKFSLYSKKVEPAKTFT